MLKTAVKLKNRERIDGNLDAEKIKRLVVKPFLSIHKLNFQTGRQHKVKRIGKWVPQLYPAMAILQRGR